MVVATVADTRTRMLPVEDFYIIVIFPRILTGGLGSEVELKGILCTVISVLLFIGMLTLVSNTQSEYETQPHDNVESKATASIASASGVAEVRFDPEPYVFVVERGVDTGYRFNTTIELYDVVELFAWQVRVYFNKTVLNATNAFYHPNEPIHSVTYIPVSPVIENNFNETHGYVQHAISTIYPNHVNVTKESYPLGIEASLIEFEILMTPPPVERLETSLSLYNDNTRLVWKDGATEIDSTKRDGLYHLSASIMVPHDYDTIQEAINAATPRDSIFVYNGTYYENLVVNKTVLLFGQGPSKVIINGSGETVVAIAADRVIVDGFKITSGGDGIHASETCDGVAISHNNISNNIGRGIFASAYVLPGHNNWTISNNYIMNNTGSAIYARTCDRWNVQHNTLALNGDGIYADGIRGCNYWTVYNSTALNNTNYGIRVSTLQSSWIIIDNDFTGNRLGIFLCGNSHVLKTNSMSENTYDFYSRGSGGYNDIDPTNTVNGKPVYFWVDRTEGEIPYDAGYIGLVSCENIVIRDFNLSENGEGIALRYCDNITIEGSHLTRNGAGIYVDSSRNLVLRDCTLSNGEAGIGIGGVTRNVLVSDIDITNNSVGIGIFQSYNITIHDNHIANSSESGIHLTISDNNTIYANNLVQNDLGIDLYGSSGNHIYHNNFLQNLQHARAYQDNDWDLSYSYGGGNYWSNYTGPDECQGIYQNETGSDGIVDDSYVIGQSNIDYYPLSAPWSSPVHVILPGNTSYRGEEVSLMFTVDFSADWIGYSLDSEANVTIAGNTTLTDLLMGKHYIVIYANDSSGTMYFSVRANFIMTFLTDLNYDRTVDVLDLAMVCYAYGSVLGDPRWECKIDVNLDGIIDIEDVAMVVDEYGQTWY